MGLKSEDWKKLFYGTEDALKSIRKLNFFEVVTLIKKAEEEGKVIKGKNIILFIGPTGAGKSTTIHALSGSTMELVKLNGYNHIGPKSILNKDAE